MSQYHAAKIMHKTMASPTVAVLKLEVPELATFLPGQWVDFVVPPHPWIGGFSIASSPRDLPYITLAVKKSDHPPAKWVHEQSEVDTQVQIQVGGNSVLQNDDVDAPRYFCAGGIGISPVLSQYREFLFQRDSSLGTLRAPAKFLYSTSTPDELVFASELSNLAKGAKKSHKNDQMIFTITQSGTWDESNFSDAVELKTGRVLFPFLESAPSNAIFYLCGPPNMLDEAVSYLTTIRSIPLTNIRYEKWW